ncbi:MAG TPA: VOC family protein [Acidimicrobiales bacterium]
MTFDEVIGHMVFLSRYQEIRSPLPNPLLSVMLNDMPTITTHDDGMPIWIDINVETLEQHHDLRAFLSALYGWTWDVSGPEMGHYAIASHDGQPVLGVGQGEGARGEATTYFKTSTIDETFDQAIELGSSIVFPVSPVSDIGTMAIMTDPFGARFGLWQPATFNGFGVVYEANAPGWFDHVSSDPAAAGEFYASITGHTLFSPDPDMRILQNGEQWFASISESQTGAGPQWNPIMVVDSLKRIHETVPRLGGAILIEEMPVPGSSLCVFSEPVNGTMMTVMQGGDHPD